MKIETRGKYPGVKIHLDAEECQKILNGTTYYTGDNKIPGHDKGLGYYEFEIKALMPIAAKMGKMIRDLLKENPRLLQERTKEEVLAILAKESEKSALQLATLKRGGDIAKVDKQALKEALLKHAK